jgi:hypothetical protein
VSHCVKKNKKNVNNICQKVVKSCQKGCRKAAKKCQKVVKKVVKKVVNGQQRWWVGGGNSSSKAFGINFADRPKAKKVAEIKGVSVSVNGGLFEMTPYGCSSTSVLYLQKKPHWEI